MVNATVLTPPRPTSPGHPRLLRQTSSPGAPSAATGGNDGRIRLLLNADPKTEQGVDGVDGI